MCHRHHIAAVRHFYRTHSPYLASKYRHKGDKGQRWQVTSNIGDKGIKSQDRGGQSYQTALLIPRVIQDIPSIQKLNHSDNKTEVTGHG